jgi:hypothetical protein
MDNVNKDPNAVSFGITRFREVDFSITPGGLQASTEMALEYLCEFSLQFLDGSVSFTTQIDVKEGNTNDVLKLTTELVIKFDSESWDRMKNDEIVNVPKQFIANAVICAVGSTRGLLTAKTIGTSMQSIILPLLSISTLLPDVPDQFKSLFA